MSIHGVARRVVRGARRAVRGVRVTGGRVPGARRRRRRRGISGAELRGYRKVSRLVSDALMIVPHARRGLRTHRRRRGRFGDPESEWEGD